MAMVQRLGRTDCSPGQSFSYSKYHFSSGAWLLMLQRRIKAGFHAILIHRFYTGTELNLQIKL